MSWTPTTLSKDRPTDMSSTSPLLPSTGSCNQLSIPTPGMPAGRKPSTSVTFSSPLRCPMPPTK
jgi:hypothetical protein